MYVSWRRSLPVLKFTQTTLPRTNSAGTTLCGRFSDSLPRTVPPVALHGYSGTQYVERAVREALRSERKEKNGMREGTVGKEGMRSMAGEGMESFVSMATVPPAAAAAAAAAYPFSAPASPAWHFDSPPREPVCPLSPRRATLLSPPRKKRSDGSCFPLRHRYYWLVLSLPLRRRLYPAPFFPSFLPSPSLFFLPICLSFCFFSFQSAEHDEEVCEPDQASY